MLTWLPGHSECMMSCCRSEDTAWTSAESFPVVGTTKDEVGKDHTTPCWIPASAEPDGGDYFLASIGLILMLRKET